MKRITNNKFGVCLKNSILLICSKNDVKKIISGDWLFSKIENIGKIDPKLNNSKNTANNIRVIKINNYTLFTNFKEKKILFIFRYQRF